MIAPDRLIKPNRPMQELKCSNLRLLYEIEDQEVNRLAEESLRLQELRDSSRQILYRESDFARRQFLERSIVEAIRRLGEVDAQLAGQFKRRNRAEQAYKAFECEGSFGPLNVIED